MTMQSHSRGSSTITTDHSKLDIPFLHSYLTDSYWAKGIPLETMKRAIENSLCFGVFEGARQIGFARVITDYATFAYLADVFIIDEFRRRGLAKWLMECVVSHPSLQGLRRWTLATRDAHWLYAKYGFTPLQMPDRWMERHDPQVYLRWTKARD